MAFFDEITITNKQLQKEKYCYVKAAGQVNPDPRYSVARENSPTTVFAYVTSGKMHLETKEKTYDLLAGDSYIVPAHIYSKVYSDLTNPASMLWINTEGLLIDSLYDLYFDKNFPVVATCNIEMDLKKIMHSIDLEKAENTEDENALLLHKMMLAVKKSLSFKIQHIAEQPVTLEERISCYITTHIQEKFDLENLCKTFYVSVSKLNDIFRKEFQCTPYQYYQTIRYTISQKMLLETDLSIDDIASRLNFVDRNHFSKFFYSRAGVSPAGYRKLNRK